jgi:hypothetical protein
MFFMTVRPSASSDTISVVPLWLTFVEWAFIPFGDPREVSKWVQATVLHSVRAARLTWGQTSLDGRKVERIANVACYGFWPAAEISSIDAINMNGTCHGLHRWVQADPMRATLGDRTGRRPTSVVQPVRQLLGKANLAAWLF